MTHDDGHFDEQAFQLRREIETLREQLSVQRRHEREARQMTEEMNVIISEAQERLASAYQALMPPQKP